jgi:hypothetical protein
MSCGLELVERDEAGDFREIPARPVIWRRIKKLSFDVEKILFQVKDLRPLVCEWKFATQCDICGGPLGLRSRRTVTNWRFGVSVVIYDVGCYQNHGPIYCLTKSDPRVLWIRSRGAHPGYQKHQS